MHAQEKPSSKGVKVSTKFFSTTRQGLPPAIKADDV